MENKRLIHYHGTPITPHSSLYRMAGKHFCVSYYRKDNDDWCMQNGQSVMWDNGAFSFYTKGLEPDWNGFYKWLEKRLGHPHWAVIPDVIDGSIDDNLALIKQFPFSKELGAVVWHMAEPIDHLKRLIDLGFGKVCFGSSGAFWEVGSESWEQRCDKAFNALVQTYNSIPHIHMLRGLSMAGDRYPFASADSTNVATSFKGYGHTTAICPERMARRIDSVQCPIIWKERATQDDLFLPSDPLLFDAIPFCDKHEK